LTGRFTDHHAFLLSKMIARIEQVEADIREVDARIEQQIAPFAPAAARLLEIPGIGSVAAATIIAEIGVGMTCFPTPAHLAGWAKFAPGVKESAGRRKGRGSTGHGNRYLARVLGQIAVSAAGTSTFLGERYRRITRRRGAKRAIVAVGRSVLTIIWHLLSDPAAGFRDLGADFYLSRTDTERRKRNHIRQLEALGYRVTLDLAA
jgi:transposase